MAQSAVSQQIRKLEQELGIVVFRRSSRSVELTAEGRVVLDYAHRVIGEVDGLRDELDELAGALRGELRIGGMYPTGPYDLFGMLAEFRGEHPGVSIHMKEGAQDELLAMLKADELDCVFTAVDPDTLGDEYAATLIWQEEFVVAMPVDHALAAREHVTFEELAGEDLIAYRDNSALRRRLESTLGTRGLTTRNAFVCTEMAAVRALAAKGLGIAVLPRSIAEEPGPPIVLRPFDPPITWPVALIWRAQRRQPAASRAFLSLAIKRAEEAEPHPLELVA